MGFFSGRVTFARYQVQGPPPGLFGPEHLKRLRTRAIGSKKVVAADGIEVGWTAGGHVLDTAFELERNVVNDALHFCMRIDSQRLPADLLRAYTQIELEALAKDNPSGLPSANQKREARETAVARLEEEARDGRFVRRKAYPVLWDGQANELLVGTTAVTALDRLHTLFEETFGLGFEPLTAGRQAFRLAEPRSQARAVDDAAPSPFVPGQSPSEVAWVLDETSRDFVGNEFLLWLWFMLDCDSDSLSLPDDSEASVLLTRTLVLECPRGQTGKQTLSSEGPARLPEARRALQSGKLPRKAGLILSRHDQQYELTLHAETLAVTGCKMPAPEAVEERARLEERVTQLRQLLETLDLLFDAFGQKRFGDDWPRELARMQKWLARDKADRVSATG